MFLKGIAQFQIEPCTMRQRNYKMLISNSSAYLIVERPSEVLEVGVVKKLGFVVRDTLAQRSDAASTDFGVDITMPMDENTIE